MTNEIRHKNAMFLMFFAAHRDAAVGLTDEILRRVISNIKKGTAGN